jgi:hypothetical protein
MPLHRISTFNARAPATVDVSFTDGVSKSIDLSPMLNHLTYSKMYSALRRPDYFVLGKLDQECNVPIWPDGTDISPALLYEWEQRLPFILQQTAL